ncbi:MAG TPA: hypothetical protein VI409_00510 [Gaiellaceae bacterium]|nr:hypothetical protein [Gaiellaceae bacterium]
MRALMLVTTIAAAALLSVGCGGGEPAALPQGSEPVELDPAGFTIEIDNPYWPMAPGTTWVYSETDGEGNEQRVEVTVTSETKEIMSIEARVIHDLVTENGKPVEDTLDWYAQDADGNIWYLGEDTKEYENGRVVSTAGSWEAGVDGAQPGVIVPAAPEVGMTYRQEYYAGEAEDAAAVLSLDEWTQVPYGSFRDVLMTKDYTPLDPDVLEYKLYARGIGPVLVLGVSGGGGREELLELTKR